MSLKICDNLMLPCEQRKIAKFYVIDGVVWGCYLKEGPYKNYQSFPITTSTISYSRQTFVWMLNFCQVGTQLKETYVGT